jgi:cell division protein FtsQ
VEALPGVRVAHVHRDWPGTLIIDVTRRTAVAAAPDGKAYVLLDASGVAFRRVSATPTVTLIALQSPGPDDPATLSALSVLRSLPPEIGDVLVSMTAATPADVTLILQGHRTIIWGDSSDNAAKGRVATSLLRRPGTVIDVSAPNVVTVR